MEDDFQYLDDRYRARANRRSFLSAALATVTVAAVTGGTAALLLEEDEAKSLPATKVSAPETTSRIATPSTIVAQGVLPTPGDQSDLQNRLTALEAENSTLRASLSAAEQQLASYSNIEAEADAGQAWRQEYEQANAQATELAGQLAAVQGLLAIYEELEAVDLAAAASGGVAALGGVLGDLIADVPLVTEGLSAGRKALEEFEEQIPLVEQGRYWLQGQMAIVGSALEAAETTLSNALKAGGSFLQLLNRWFEDILKWLPFGIGQPALAVMDAIGDLLAKVPETLHGLQTNVATPLNLWLERDGDEIRLQQRLIKPVREEALDRADSTVGRLGSVNDVYAVQLREPVTTLAERQRLIREQIAHYRQNHAL